MFQSSRRTRSFSSSSSSSSSRGSYYFPDDSPLSAAATPIRSFSGNIPFSWEHLPGIPKKHSPARLRRDSASLLPLPPNSATPPSAKRFAAFHDWRKSSRLNQNPQRDPFFDAFIECSKEPTTTAAAEIWSGGGRSNGKAVSRSLSDRFGFLNLYSSCKRTGVVSESIVNRPVTPRSSFDLLNHRTGG